MWDDFQNFQGHCSIGLPSKWTTSVREVGPYGQTFLFLTLTDRERIFYDGVVWPIARPSQLLFVHPYLGLINGTRHKHKLKERFHFKEQQNENKISKTIKITSSLKMLASLGFVFVSSPV